MIEFPISKIDIDKFQLLIDLSIYAQDAIVATLYKYTDKYYIHQIHDESNQDCVMVVFESKDKNKITEDVPKQFCNDLIDQQVRYIMNNQYGHIRDLIVEEAFKPVSK